jgi:hypothetical protein
MRWKIYYDDGHTYTGDPYHAPVLGVLVIVEVDADHGRRLITNADYFCLEDRGDGERWWEADQVGLIDYLIRPGPKRVLIGRLVPNAVYERVYQSAYSDPDFAPKTAKALRHHGRSV